ncbi:SDR family oxidoreductase [Bdellovibrionota bacterium FG-1]
MKIIVTGALGHIGSKLIRELPKRFSQAEIVMVDNMLVQRYCSLFNLPPEGKYRFIEGDVLKMDLDQLIQCASAVVHLAAITNAAASFDHPELVEKVNYEATVLMGKACARHKVPLLYLSTTSVYGTQAKVVDENCRPDELQPQSPYADSKIRGERELTELGKTQGLRFVTCRFGTIFGTSIGMRFHTAVNKFCWQAVTGQPITVWKTAYDQKRPYLDLEDGVAAIGFILENDLFDREIYNVLTVNLTVRGVVEAIQKHIPSLHVEFVEQRIMNQLSYEVSFEKFRAKGFTPRGDAKRAIGETIALIRGANGG